jgi:RimJ/RimL family protein N-acetyltransferase
VSTAAVSLREVLEADLPILFEHQLDPEATRMADFPSRDRDAFMSHWARSMLDAQNILKTILYHSRVAGNIVSWLQSSERLVGYWIGKEFWGQGIATQALTAFLLEVQSRPLYAHVAKHNLGSQRVLEKCGFEQFSQQLTDSTQGARVDELTFVLRSGPPG